MQDVVDGLIRQSVQWVEWVNNNAEIMLKQEYSFQNTKNELFKLTLYETVMHVMNHSTYHRGQLVTMMRTLGIKTIPQTDFMVFIRKKKN